ncbi:transmembrane emp24 domain-containing protein 5-like [Zerene cesonia]|uniref:transmembrane emp24 domain-containing protein 5-like n=1 Tax=Zerene cesonia TaxID=33412 RepID=UPI0018E53D7E|nr:transmembrane emp24 domain-containing protein 5-like [Zerene cesonia]
MDLYQLGVMLITCKLIATQAIFESDVNIRIDAGTRTCIFEKGQAGQIMEFYYQVLDGQHGDLDISVDVFDPKGNKIIAEHKKTQNSIIMDLENSGDFVFCLDNTHSVMNSKLVYFYVVIEDKEKDQETTVNAVGNDGHEYEEGEVVEWIGTDANGEEYAMNVSEIIEYLRRVLNHVVRARHMLDIYSATKTRDSYLALEDTFIVDVWSTFQITFMVCVGMIQVYMIKRLFDRPYCI